jgi:serine/threonine protein kinase
VKIIQVDNGAPQQILALCRKSRRKVLITLFKNFEENEVMCRDILRLISIQRHVSGPRSVLTNLVDTIYVEGNIFVVRDFYATNLRTNMNKENNVSEDHLIMILYNLLCAIKTMHASNIILRDLKPENIMIDENCQVKLACTGKERTLPKSCIGPGSGNSKRIRDSIYQQELKQKHDATFINNMIAAKVEKIKSSQVDKEKCLSPMIGSCRYRAPEISISEPQYDQASDMWSLGCILYEQMKFLNQTDLEKMTEEQRKEFQSSK